MATHHLYVLAVQTDDEHADTLRQVVLSAVTAAGLTPAPCHWAPDPDTVAEGLDVDFHELRIHDLNPDRV